LETLLEERDYFIVTSGLWIEFVSSLGKKMTEKPNGLQIVVHETEPTARIYMFIDGEYTHWVEYDLEQMQNLISVVHEKWYQMLDRYVVNGERDDR
jgi:uncharacterized protein YxjI